MVAERLRLVTHRCAAVTLDQAALSNTWWPVAFATEDAQRMARLSGLWLNSTLGLLGVLMLAEETQGPWVKIKKNKLPELPVLDPSQLGDEGEALLDQWAHLSTLEFLTIAQLARDPARATLDGAIAEVLGIEPESISAVREMLGGEASATARPSKARSVLTSLMMRAVGCQADARHCPRNQKCPPTRSESVCTPNGSDTCQPRTFIRPSVLRPRLALAKTLAKQARSHPRAASNSLILSGSDGTRTRDLRRDRPLPASTAAVTCRADTEGAGGGRPTGMKPGTPICVPFSFNLSPAPPLTPGGQYAGRSPLTVKSDEDWRLTFSTRRPAGREQSQNTTLLTGWRRVARLGSRVKCGGAHQLRSAPRLLPFVLLR